MPFARQATKYTSQVPDLKPDEYSEVILELIRCDIPVLVEGASSIGKSYSITEFVKGNISDHAFLFIGSEKSEYIEGIPEIRLAKDEAGQENKTRFSYMRPFWFPDALKIRMSLKQGRDAFNKGYEEAKYSLRSYSDLLNYKASLVSRLASGEKSVKDEISYISMIQGYGNFWLILDEVDKVEEYDRDKFAPLLHIVRERNLKGWTMRGVAANNETKPFTTIEQRKAIIDNAIDLKDAAGKPIYVTNEEGKQTVVTDLAFDNITDTRVIAICNRSIQIAEEALVRRFVHFLVDKPLYTGIKKSKDESEMSKSELIAYYNEEKRGSVHSCIVKSDIGGEPILSKMASLKERKKYMVQPLREINLAWTLGFIPDMLFPFYGELAKENEKEGLIYNLFIDDFWARAKKGKGEQVHGYIGKILIDNFAPEYAEKLMDCIQDQFVTKEEVRDDVEMRAMRLLERLKGNFSDPDPKILDKIVDDYYSSGMKYADKYTELIKNQSTSLSDKDKKSGIFPDKPAKPEDIAEQTKATQQVESEIMFWVQAGYRAIQKTIVKNVPTKATSAFVSSLPLIMKQVVGGHIGTSADLYARYELIEDEEMSKIVLQSTSEKAPTDDTAKDRFFEAAGKKFATSLGAPNEKYLYKYGYGVSSDADAATLRELIADSPTKTNKAKVAEIISRIDKAVIMEPTLRSWAVDLDKKVWSDYLNRLVSYIVIQKRAASGIPTILGAMVNDKSAIALAETGKGADELFEPVKDVVATSPGRFIEIIMALESKKVITKTASSNMSEAVTMIHHKDPDKQAEFDKAKGLV